MAALRVFGIVRRPNSFDLSIKSCIRTNISRNFCLYQSLNSRKYRKTHEWVSVTDGKEEIVGVTKYCQDALGDIVYAQLPEINDLVVKGEECGALESVKAASEIYAPVSGTITALNEDLAEHPGLINECPYEQGWLFKVKLSKTEDMSGLMDEKAYLEFVKGEEPL